MKNSRFERSPYGRAIRAGELNSNAVSNWWNSAVRETLNKTGGKNLTIPDRAKKAQFNDEQERIKALVRNGVAVGQLEMAL
jgi:hypothetical protein